MSTLIEAPSDRLLAGIKMLLARKGIATAEEIAARVEQTDKGSPAQGGRMVARAWTDPEYRGLLLRDGAQAAEAMGIPMRGLPPLGVLENTADLHNLVVCTLCSCYPRGVLGYPPFWFKSPGYRARAIRDPRGVLAEFGTTLPEHMRIRVVDSTADYRWMVLPARPAGTEGWGQARLAALLTEGDMIGVTVPKA